MWRMIELRLRSRLWIYGLIYLAAWIAAAAVAVFVPSLRAPERLATLAGGLALAIAFLAQAVIQSIESRESRMALHFTLPLSQTRLITRQVIEPMLPFCALTLLTLALAAGARVIVGGDLERSALGLLGGIAAVMLAVGQTQILVEELQSQVRWRQTLASALIFILAGTGTVVGYLLASFALAGEGDARTTIETFAQAYFISSLLAITLLLAELNRHLKARRQSFLS